MTDLISCENTNMNDSVVLNIVFAKTFRVTECATPTLCLGYADNNVNISILVLRIQYLHTTRRIYTTAALSVNMVCHVIVSRYCNSYCYLT